MIDARLKAINEGNMVGCVLVDFRKAFDLIDHQIRLKKLQCEPRHDKTNKMAVRPAKTQNSLGIRQV